MGLIEKMSSNNNTDDDSINVGQVFVAGGEPTYTYVSRSDREIETRITDWQENSRKILHLMGPTKSGKTVIINRLIGDSVVKISGGSVNGEAEFWDQLCNSLRASLESHITKAEKVSMGVEVNSGVGAVIATLKATVKSLSEYSESRTEVVRRSPKTAVLEALKNLPLVLVIDDFHYIDANTQSSLIRAFKDPVFNGLKLVLLSVPHREFDIARAETEMDGRFLNIEMDPWTVDEIAQIGIQGFKTLNCVDVENKVAYTLANEAFGNPLLMQEICLHYASSNGIKTNKNGKALSIVSPEQLFSKMDLDAGKNAFQQIVQGPSARTDRKQRRIQNGKPSPRFFSGDSGDIYVSVLAAIAENIPPLQLDYEEIRAGLKEFLNPDDVPQKHEVTNVLSSITKICRERIPGEPVLEYDRALNKLVISDPFFAFYLKWGRL